MFISDIFENVSPIDLAEILFNAIEKKYPELITRYGHEVVGDAIMDRAEEETNVHSMGEVAIIVDEIVEELKNRNQGQDDIDVAEGSTGVSVRKWANQVRKDHGTDIKFVNRKEGGGAVDSVIAKNSQGETVGVYNRKTGYPTVFEPKQDVAEGEVVPFKQKNPLTPNLIKQLKALSQQALELFWEGSYMPTALQGQVAQLGKNEEQRMFKQNEAAFKALGYEYSIVEDSQDLLYLHSIAREAWYDADKLANQYRGLPDLQYNAETNTLSYYDLIGDDGYEYNDNTQFEGVAEGLKFHGGFPDVDHMPGPVIRNADMTTDNVKTKNKKDWDRAVDSINARVFDDMAEFRTDRHGESVVGNSAVWAKWDNATQTGWFNAKGRPLKPWPVKEQGVAEDGFNKPLFKSKEDAVAYAKEKVKTFRDSLDGIEIWAMPDGSFDTVATMNSNGRNHCVANGGKRLGVIYRNQQGVAEVSDKTLTSYLTNVDADSRKHKSDPTKRSPEKANRSVQGFSRAFNKLDARKATDLVKRVGEAEGDEEGLPHLTPKLASHISQQIDTEGPHAVDKSINWGDGAAEELLAKIKEMLDDYAGIKTEAAKMFEAFEEYVEANNLSENVYDTYSDEQIITEVAAWQKKSGKNKNGGLNKKGVASYRREHPGSKLQTAVTTKPSKLKKGSKAAKRRKSFCARMGGMKGPMKDEHGKPTRKALALRKWHCESVEQFESLIQQTILEAGITKSLHTQNPCWKGYHPVGTKKKGGRTVPNCVPTSEAANPAQQAAVAIAKKKKQGVAEGKDTTPPGSPAWKDGYRAGLKDTTNKKPVGSYAYCDGWKAAKKKQGVAENTGVTDYNPKSQGGTRKELLAKYHKTKNHKDAEAARKAGATQKELQGVAEEQLNELDLFDKQKSYFKMGNGQWIVANYRNVGSLNGPAYDQTFFKSLQWLPQNVSQALGLDSKLANKGPYVTNLYDFTDKNALDYSNANKELIDAIENWVVKNPPAAPSKVQQGVTKVQDLAETRLYYTIKATLTESLINDFNMKQDTDGWYLTTESGRYSILEAHRAFGAPKIKEVKLKEVNINLADFTGSAATVGSQNNISPIGSKKTNKGF
jgi:hypothetical protein